MRTRLFAKQLNNLGVWGVGLAKGPAQHPNYSGGEAAGVDEGLFKDFANSPGPCASSYCGCFQQRTI